MILEYLERYLRDEAAKRTETPNNPLRASAMGRCIREGCFDLLGLPGEPLQPRRMLTLMNGAVIHDDLLTPLLHKALGWRFIEDVEGGEVEIDRVKISYHIDGAFQHMGQPDDMEYPMGKEEIGIIEIKSMSDYAFNRALKGEIDRDYLCQSWVYFKATDFNPVVFLAYRKETSAMVEIVFDRQVHEKIVCQRLTGNAIELAKQDPILLTEIKSPFDESVEGHVRERIKWLKRTQADSMTERGILDLVPGADAIEDEVEKVQGRDKAMAAQVKYGTTWEQNGSWYSFKTGRKILGFPCSYCSHRVRCFPNSKLEIKGERPVWTL